MTLHRKVNADYAPGATRLRVRRLLPLGFLLLLAAASAARAIDPGQRITQYGHTAWRVRDGDLPPATAIVQTADSYIWIGTRNGLMRFDGVKFTAWTPPEGQALPGRAISAFLSASDGSLWIGTPNGLGRLKDDRITNYPAQPGTGGVGAIIEDETGAIWFTRYRIADGKGPLCRVKDGELRCFGKEDGVPVDYGLGLVKDATGNFWFGSSALCRWTPESSGVYFAEELKHTGGDGVNAVAADPSGTIWAALDGVGPGLGVRRHSGGRWSGYVVPGFDGPAVRAATLYRDRRNSLWVGSTTEGLYRIHDGVADRYGMKDGLSGDFVSHLFEDREGNLWVVTENGVDMFRDTPVVSFSSSEGLSSANIDSVLALRDGSVWVANMGAVDVIPRDGRSPIIRLKGLPGQEVGAMLEDRAGRVWVGVDDRLVIYESNQFSEVRKPDGRPLGHTGTAWAMTADGDGNVWVGVSNGRRRRLLRVRGRVVEDDITLGDLVWRAESLAADRRGEVWVSSERDKLTRRRRDGQTETVSLGDEGATTIYSIFVDSEDALWASTVKGVYRWKDGALSLLDSRNGLPCSAVYSAIGDDSGDFWFYARCGLMKVPAADMAAWRKSPESKVSVRIFDALDGALPAPGSVNQRRASKSPDGRLWFTNGRAVQVIDPRRDYDDTVPPPVRVEGLIADHKSYGTQGQPTLPPLRSELEIDYTALSYAVPRKVKFRYKLEGHDADWHDAGTRRQAFYNDLGPGQYRFRVVAGKDDEVWNETGAALDFTIEPTWYQTTAFRLLCVLTIASIAWALHRLRIKQVARTINARFDERLDERTHLARELHDTFLQTVQGSKLVADDALEHAGDPARMHRAMEKLSEWLGRATEEGRAALDCLRASTAQTNDLAEALRRAAEDCQDRANTAVAFSVIGDARDMHPIIRDEIYRIGYEAIRNACEHSGAERLEVELRYEQDLVVRVSDDGRGIDPAIVENGKPGHFGLQGMRERAERVGGKLTLVSSADSGTEVTVVVPGGVVFRKADAVPSQWIKVIFGR